MKRCRFTALSLVALLACACSKEAQPVASSGGGALEVYYAATPATGAKSVRDLRATAKSGDEVVFVGRAKDFVDGRAAVTLIDASLPACDEAGPMPDCSTPWDFCCDDPKDVAAVCALVELHDAQGLVKQGLRGFHGLEYLDTVTVKGKFEAGEQGVPTIVAQSIAITKRVKSAHK